MSTYRTLSAGEFLAADQIGIKPFTPWVGDPPKVWNPKSNNEDQQRKDVLAYAWSIAAELMNDPVLSQFHKNCNYYMQIWAGMQEPTLQNLAKRRINYARLGVNTRHNQLAANPLEICYLSDKPNQYHDLSVAINRLFKWHHAKTEYNKFRAWVEISASVFGIAAGLFYPEISWKTGDVIPGMWQKVDPRMIYVNPAEEHPSAIMIRHLEPGRLLDQKHRDVLKRRGLQYFPRGTQLYQNFGMRTPRSTRQALMMTGDTNVEVLRFWVVDYRTHKEKVFRTDTEEAVMEQMIAEAETEPIFGGLLPKSGEDHYNHELVHAQIEESEGMNWDSLQKQKWDEHRMLHQQMLKNGDQKPSDVIISPMFKGGWRYMKFIGGELITDGSSGLDGEPMPVAFFPNGIHPELPLCPPSDMEDLIPLQRDINEFVHNWVVSSRRASFPLEFWPAEMGDPEKYPKGAGVRIQIPPNVEKHRLPYSMTMPSYPADAKEALYFLINAMQQIGGSPPVTRGEGAPHRSSGREQAILLQEAEKEYVVTQDYFTWGHRRAASIILAQIKQFGSQDIIVPAMGDYARSWEIARSDIDLDAILTVERVSGSRDILSENDEKILHFALFFAKELGYPADIITKIIAQETDTAMASRIAGLVDKEMQILRQQEAMAALAAQQQGGQPGIQGMPPGQNQMNNIAMDQEMANNLAGQFQGGGGGGIPGL